MLIDLNAKESNISPFSINPKSVCLLQEERDKLEIGLLSSIRGFPEKTAITG
jgi:hypothetical protein